MPMEAQEMEVPEFLKNSSEEEIHAKMLSNLPEDIDKSEAGFPWDFTRPTAIELSELKQYVLVELLKSMFPSTCEESYLLDKHGEIRGLNRRESVSATGHVQVTGAAGTVVPLGYTFSTQADEEGNTVDFVSTEEVVIDTYGNAVIPIEAVEGGVQGNVGANTILMQVGDVNGDILTEINSVTNLLATEGGRDEEDDDSYRERIVEYDQSQDASYIGNPQDYKRWAMSVPGVGAVTVIPATDDSGTVTLIITGQDGQPADKDLCKEVEDYIMGTDNNEERLAPIGAVVVATAPDVLYIDVGATVYINGTTIETVTQKFYDAMEKYLLSSISDKVIRLSRVANILGNITGVYDYENLQIASIIKSIPGNISIPDNQIPVIGNVVFTEGE